MDKQTKDGIRSLARELSLKYANRAELKRKLSRLHHDNNVKKIPFDIWELKGLESDISIVSDEISSIEAQIESLRLQ